MRSLALSLAGALTIVFLADSASAGDPSDAARAAAVLFDEGRRLMETEDYAAACQKLAESQALDPAPDTALNLGVCYQKASQGAFSAAHALARPSEENHLGSARASAPEADGPRPGQTQRVIGLTIGGAGVAGIVTGLVTAFVAKDVYDRSRSLGRPQSEQAFDSANQLATTSNLSLLVGAVAAGAGAIVFFTAPSAKPSAGTTVGVAPTVGGACISVAGRL
jgi:hypothetical protein